MSHDHGVPAGITRRAWLKGLSVIGAVALAPPALLSAQPAPPVPAVEPLHVLVGSERLAAAFTAAGRSLRDLRVTVTPNSAALKAAIAADSRATLLLHTVPAALPGLWTTLRVVNRPWLIFNGGEDLPSTAPGLADRPTVTLDQWRANWLLGIQAAQSHSGRLLVIADPYDTAYDAIDAFHTAFTLHGGGDVRFAFMAASEPDRTAVLSAALAQHQPTVLFASTSGRAAATFAAQYAAHGAGLPLYTSPFLLWDAPIPGAVAASAYAPDVHSAAATWYDYLAQEALTAFVSGSTPSERPLYRLNGTGRASGTLSGDTSAAPLLIHPGGVKVGALHPYLPLA